LAHRRSAALDEVCGFFIFQFRFLQKIYFYFRNLQEYTPAAPLPGGRHLAAPLPAAPLLGGRGFSAKIFAENLHPGPWRTGRPTAGRPAPRPPGGRAAGTLTLSCINLALTHAPHAAAYSAAAGAEHVRARRSRLPAIKQTAVRVGTYVGRGRSEPQGRGRGRSIERQRQPARARAESYCM